MSLRRDQDGAGRNLAVGLAKIGAGGTVGDRCGSVRSGDERSRRTRATENDDRGGDHGRLAADHVEPRRRLGSHAPRIAAPMVGGMISSTLLTLIVIPAIYALVEQQLLR
jgi:hypothetical protein